MITWPCIFKLDGDSELLYLGSNSQLVTELEGLIWDSSDRLIDSYGQCFLVKIEGDGYLLESEGIKLTLSEVTQLVQEHEFAKAEMCLTKIHFSSIAEAITSLSLEK
tara:strand:- start:423 stop:743 length:321 start_codon:yes stop_codon:yes gene_type:complete